MIEMGDDLLYTSSVFDQMEPPVYLKQLLGLQSTRLFLKVLHIVSCAMK